MSRIGDILKAKRSNLVVVCTGEEKDDTFYGTVITPDGEMEFGEMGHFNVSSFEPCEAPQGTGATKPEPSPTKDTELRLECLKLASKNRHGLSKELIMQLAQDYCDWVQEKIEVVPKSQQKTFRGIHTS